MHKGSKGEGAATRPPPLFGSTTALSRRLSQPPAAPIFLISRRRENRG